MTFKFDPAEYAEMPSHLIRRDISSQVERMIDYLDSLEPDADLEPDEDAEESLGWCMDTGGGCRAHAFISMAKEWCDLEGDEHDGREPEVDECSLGWTNRVNQDCPDWHGAGSKDWSAPANTDLEAGDDNGIADEGGLQEQWGATLPFDPSVAVRHMEGVL